MRSIELFALLAYLITYYVSHMYPRAVGVNAS